MARLLSPKVYLIDLATLVVFLSLLPINLLPASDNLFCITSKTLLYPTAIIFFTSFFIKCDKSRRKLDVTLITIFIVTLILALILSSTSLNFNALLSVLGSIVLYMDAVFLLSWSSIKKPFKKDLFRTIFGIPILLYFLAVAILTYNKEPSMQPVNLTCLIFVSIIIIPYLATSIIQILDSERPSLSKHKKTVIFIASAGGHLTQITMLEPLYKNYNSYLVTEKTPIKLKVNVPIKYVIYCSRKQPISYLFKSLANLFRTFYLFAAINPDVIVTTGTHTAIPICLFGYLFRRKVIYIESFAKNSSPTMAGHFLYPFADTFIIQWKNMQKFYPKAKYFGSIY